ncbi:MAG: cyclase family protein [Tenericutes bacterium]|nr:cyclase family protein [Mycoplasmatota bacterium]
MNKWIDLTILIDEETVLYPGDTPFTVVDEKKFNVDGYNMKRLYTNMHVGTHLDVKKHVFDVEEGIEAIDINKLIGKALVIRPSIDNLIVNSDDIIKNYIEGYTIIILDLGWSKFLNTDKYYNHPKFDKKIVPFLRKKGIEIIGIDIPSPEYADSDLFVMHKDLLENGMLIIENLTNLDKLTKTVDLIAMPLRIKGLDGSLVRCVAKNINIY